MVSNLSDGPRLSVVEFVLGGRAAVIPAQVIKDLGGVDNAPDAATLVHLSEALGFKALGDPDEERVLSLEVVIEGEDCRAQVVVDGPVTFRSLEPEHLLKMPVGLSRGIAGPVVAITEDNGELGYVLDPELLFRFVATEQSPSQ